MFSIHIRPGGNTIMQSLNCQNNFSSISWTPWTLFSIHICPVGNTIMHSLNCQLIIKYIFDDHQELCSASTFDQEEIQSCTAWIIVIYFDHIKNTVEHPHPPRRKYVQSCKAWIVKMIFDQYYDSWTLFSIHIRPGIKSMNCQSLNHQS